MGETSLSEYMVACVCVVSVLLSFIIYPETFELDEGGSGLEFGRRDDMEVNGGLRADVG